MSSDFQEQIEYLKNEVRFLRRQLDTMEKGLLLRLDTIINNSGGPPYCIKTSEGSFTTNDNREYFKREIKND